MEEKLRPHPLLSTNQCHQPVSHPKIPTHKQSSLVTQTGHNYWTGGVWLPYISPLLVLTCIFVYFFFLLADGQLWKEVKQEVDYLLKPQVLADAERHVRSANLSRIVLIDNLQQAIEVENPPAEEIAQLQNRKGKWNFFFSNSHLGIDAGNLLGCWGGGNSGVVLGNNFYHQIFEIRKKYYMNVVVGKYVKIFCEYFKPQLVFYLLWLKKINYKSSFISQTWFIIYTSEKFIEKISDHNLWLFCTSVNDIYFNITTNQIRWISSAPSTRR